MLTRKLKHEIIGESVKISSYLPFQLFGFYFI